MPCFEYKVKCTEYRKLDARADGGFDGPSAGSPAPVACS